MTTAGDGTSKLSALESQLRAWYAGYDGDGSSADAIHQALAEAILARSLGPGARLGEERLARLFSVSRTPVREALMRLESEGLATRHRRAGLIVAAITQEQILEIYVIREALDGISARLAAQFHNQADIASLERLNQGMAEAARNHAFDEMARLNVAFHQTLARASRNEMLQQFVGEVHRAVRRFRETTFSFGTRAEEAVREHHTLIAAIAEGDAERAESIARAHMHRALEIRMRMEGS